MSGSEKPIINEKGEYVNCFGFVAHDVKGQAACATLKDWYHRTDEHGNALPHCGGCPFFKTREELEEERKIYPYQKPNKKEG